MTHKHRGSVSVVQLVGGLDPETNLRVDKWTTELQEEVNRTVWEGPLLSSVN